MRFIRLTGIQLDFYLFRRRWWLSLAVATLVALWAVSAVRTYNVHYGVPVNVWDALFRVWLDYHFHFFASNLVFLVLVGDVALSTPWEQMMLSRVRSRRLWWSSKVAVLVVCVLVYTLLLVGATLVIASLNLPWENAWSAGAHRFSTEWNVHPALVHYHPLQALGATLLLLALGWLSFGLLSAVLCLVFRSFMGALIGSAALNFAGLILLLRPLPAPLNALSFQYHLLMNYHAFGDPASPYPSVPVSLLYWGIVIALLVLGGRWLSARQDFLRYAP